MIYVNPIIILRILMIVMITVIESSFSVEFDTYVFKLLESCSLLKSLMEDM